MRIAAHAADLVALHAELLARTTVTARAARRIAPRLATMLVVEGADPPRWVWARTIIAGNSVLHVTGRAPIGLVAGQTGARIGPRLQAVP